MTALAAPALAQVAAAADPPIRLLIVDDSAVARAVLSRILGVFPDFAVVAQAADARAAMDALAKTSVDIVLPDVEMPRRKSPARPSDSICFENTTSHE